MAGRLLQGPLLSVLLSQGVPSGYAVITGICQEMAAKT